MNRLFLLLLLSVPAFAQAPDCSFTFLFTTTAIQTGQSNISGATPCVNWGVTFSVTGTLTATVQFETSPDNSTFTAVPNSVCSSSVQPPCLQTGANPLATLAKHGSAKFAAYGAFVRVNVTGTSGSGTGTVRVYGYKGTNASAGNGGGGGGGSTSPSAPLFSVQYNLANAFAGDSKLLYNTVGISTPGTPTATPQGTPGVTTYSYKVAACNVIGCTLVSAAGTTTTGNATLDNSNFNRLAVASVTGAVAYLWYRTAGSSTGEIAFSTLPTVDDTGLPGDFTPPTGTLPNYSIGLQLDRRFTLPNLTPGTLSYEQVVMGDETPTFSAAARQRIGDEKSIYHFGNVGPGDSNGGLIGAYTEYPDDFNAQFAGMFFASTTGQGSPIGSYNIAANTGSAVPQDMHAIRAEIDLLTSANALNACEFCGQGILSNGGLVTGTYKGIELGTNSGVSGHAYGIAGIWNADNGTGADSWFIRHIGDAPSLHGGFFELLNQSKPAAPPSGGFETNALRLYDKSGVFCTLNSDTLEVCGGGAIAGTNVTPSIGGGALIAGACASNTATVTGAAVGMGVIATPSAYPGDGVVWNGYVSGANTVTVKVCAIIAGTPSASVYNVRVIP